VVSLGACAGMQIQAAQLLGATVPVLGYHTWVVGSSLLLVPLVLQRTLRGISIIALSGLVVLCIGLAATAANGLFAVGPPGLSAELTSLPSPAGFASFFGVAAFAFGGTQATILPIQDGMALPHEAAGALLVALMIAGALYAVVALLLASIYEYSEEGVQQMIILNLPKHSGFGFAVNSCTALVAVLSYPLPLMPVVQLLTPPAGSSPSSDARLRLSLLVVSTAVALAVPNFGRIAGFLGCLNIAFAQCLPPLLHLRLRTAHLQQSPRKRLLEAIDVALTSTGVATLVYFTLLTGRELLAGWM